MSSYCILVATACMPVWVCWSRTQAGFPCAAVICVKSRCYAAGFAGVPPGGGSVLVLLPMSAVCVPRDSLRNAVLYLFPSLVCCPSRLFYPFLSLGDVRKSGTHAGLSEDT
jgi:hypothetical protein